MKKWMILLLAAAICCTMSACSAKDEKVSAKEDTPAPAQSQEEPSKEEAPAPAEAEPQSPDTNTAPPETSPSEGTIAITEENYQSLFQPAPDYNYIGYGFYKSPEGMSSTPGFVDAYLPYVEAPAYLNDGYAIQSEAHGMRVYQTMTSSQGNAQAVVDEEYQKLVDAGVDFYPDGVAETHYVEEYDIAIKQVLFFEENGTKPRVSFLYADTRGNGYYMYAQITYLPDEYDQDHDALVEELRDVFGLQLPDIPEME